MKDKRLHKFIAITLCVTLLTISASRVTRVSAVGTTAAIAGTAFILTGAVYLSYVALTQGQIVLPAAQDLHNYLGSIGRKVAQYPSGQATYQELYQNLAREPVTGAVDDIWTWTQEKIRAYVNDFSDTRIISNIIAHDVTIDNTFTPTNGFTYPAFTDTAVAPNGTVTTLSGLQSMGYVLSFFTGHMVCYRRSTSYFMVSSNITQPVRNRLTSRNTYIGEYWNGSSWVGVQNYSLGFYADGFGSRYRYGVADYGSGYRYYVTNTDVVSTAAQEFAYPLFPQDVIYDEVTGEDLPMVIPEDNRSQLPSWIDPDNDNRPIIPWVPIPDIPSGVPTPPGYTGTPQWGFPLQDLLDMLESLAENLMSIDAIARIINEFAGQHGDNYYLEYNDGDTNYFTYYQPNNYYEGDDYVTYNINVSDVDEHLPVDLNTIELYTNNRYLDEVKRSAIAGGSIIRDLVVFWYDVDPLIVYVFFGSCIAILVAAFIGKWGHS